MVNLPLRFISGCPGSCCPYSMLGAVCQKSTTTPFHRNARLDVGHGAAHVYPVARAVETCYDGCADRLLRGVFLVEGAQDGGRGRLVGRVGDDLVRSFVDECLDTGDVAEDMAFVAAVVGYAARLIESRPSASCRRTVLRLHGP
jgi:hypothetical protein